MQWEPKMATGIAKIDAQHKELIRRINKLLDAMKEGQGREMVGEVLEFLGRYVVEHFADEEALMKKYGYPKYPEHKAIHDRFKKEFEALAAENEKRAGSLSLTLQVQNKVVDWLRNHIMNVDVKMAAQLKEKGAA
ncbi:bacteriohemerythrin [Deferrisoma camini]|uniref:bacteriohemerythrin n=1 Tax=Deferrisoma camini TaxID=1035120 RepID=UPI00046CC1E5|nr:bacteriohemerythrin [Deferrisoma camini]